MANSPGLWAGCVAFQLDQAFSLSLLEIRLGICRTPVLGKGTNEKAKELACTRVVQHKAKRNDLLVIALQLAGIQEPLHQVRSRPPSWVDLHGLRIQVLHHRHAQQTGQLTDVGSILGCQQNPV